MDTQDKKNTPKESTPKKQIRKKQTQNKQTDNPHDKGYKRIFSIKKHFLHFIKKYIALEWMMELEEKDLELIDKEFITDQFDTYESDLVYKVYTKESVIYLFFLLELQSYNDFTMPFRLLVYMTAIWLDHFKNCDKHKRSQKGYRLPAIMPIVLHNSERNWTASCKFSQMISNAELFGKYVVDFEHALVSVNTLRNRHEIKCIISSLVLYSSMIRLARLFQYQFYSSYCHLLLTRSGIYLYLQRI